MQGQAALAHVVPEGSFTEVGRQSGAGRARRRVERQKPTRVVTRPVRHTQTYGEDWAAATTVEARREVLEAPCTPSSYTGAEWAVGWAPRGSRSTGRFPEDLGPIVAPDDETLAARAQI